MRADVAMLFLRQGVHSIFDKHLLVAMLIGLTSRGIDPEAGGNPAQDDGLDLSAAHLQVQVHAKEGCTGYVRRVTHDEIADTIG